MSHSQILYGKYKLEDLPPLMRHSMSSTDIHIERVRSNLGKLKIDKSLTVGEKAKIAKKLEDDLRKGNESFEGFHNNARALISESINRREATFKMDGVNAIALVQAVKGDDNFAEALRSDKTLISAVMSTPAILSGVQRDHIERIADNWIEANDPSFLKPAKIEEMAQEFGQSRQEQASAIGAELKGFQKQAMDLNAQDFDL